MGIIGNTHGVKIDAIPRPNAVSRNAPMSSAGLPAGAEDGAAAAADPGFTSV